MKLCGFLSSILAVRLAAAYLVSPDGTAAPGANSDCSEWVQDSYALTCAIIEEIYGITEAQFEEWNPTVTEMGSGCTLLSGLYYCVQINYVSASSSLTSSITSKGQHAGSGTSTASVTATSTPSTLTTVTVTTTTSSSSSSSTPTRTTATSTTSTTTGITTPTPYQTGMAANCDSFHLVVSGDTCDDIVTAADITLTEFYDWNPAVGSSCASLWLGYYVCIGVTTATSTTTATISSTTTTSSTAITTPTPYQTGMASDCDSFYLVVSGDTCDGIVTAADITLAEFYDWNPAVGSTCASLWLGYYVCIGVTTATATTTTTSSSSTTTTSSAAVTTPTPYQTGMVTDCDLFHLVVSGDTCYDIAIAADISLTEFYDWNPDVGSTCASLWLGYYVCIGIE